MLLTKKYDVVCTFIEPLLGSQPQVETAKEFLTSKAIPEIPEDELAALPDVLERGTTAFHKVDGVPVMWNYQVRGFLKEAGMIFNGHGGVKNLRSKINNTVFVSPRIIPIENFGTITYNDRPLRAMTAQGPRIALARSEQIEAGAQIRFTLEVFKDEIKEELLRDLLSYGERQGFGQWRNASWGSFTFEMSAAK